MNHTAAWLTLAGLGAYHGVNPAMGWLFAVSRGMQERSRRAVLRSLVPIAIGHEMSIALVAALVVGLEVVTDSSTLRIVAAAVLFGFGIFRFVKPRAHFRWTSMRVSDRELTLWSFLMSTAHGAGLMLFPVLVGMPAGGGSMVMPTSVAVVLVHTLAMVAVAGATALVVYQSVGVGILRTGWFNMDRAWSYVLGAGAAATLLVA